MHQKLTIVLFIAAFSFPQTGSGAEDLSHKALHCGYNRDVIPELATKDAESAMTLWGKKLGEKFLVTSEYFDTTESIIKRVKAKDLDMVTITALDYLRLPDKSSIEPSLVGAIERDNPLQELLLLTNRKKYIRELGQLKGGKLLIQSNISEGTVLMWLDIILLKKRLPQSRIFFNIKKADNASKAALPVLFNQADAAVISRYAFNSMVELNPQLQHEFNTIAVSPPLLLTLTLFRIDYNKQWLDEITDIVTKKHMSVEGKQILALFRVTKIIPFKEEYLNSLKNLLRDHEDLLSKHRKGV